MTKGVRHAHVAGADRTFGIEVASRLRGDGVAVIGEIAALRSDTALDVLVVDVTMPVSDRRFRAVSDDDFRASLDGQLYAFVAGVQAAVPRMTSGGAIVLIVPKSYLGAWGGVHVAASAAACVAMARSMAIELASRGIRVNCVAVDSASIPADVAAMAAWLASDDSAAVTGETILADRGASLQMAQAARR